MVHIVPISWNIATAITALHITDIEDAITTQYIQRLVPSFIRIWVKNVVFCARFVLFYFLALTVSGCSTLCTNKDNIIIIAMVKIEETCRKVTMCDVL